MKPPPTSPVQCPLSSRLPMAATRRPGADYIESLATTPCVSQPTSCTRNRDPFRHLPSVQSPCFRGSKAPSSILILRLTHCDPVALTSRTSIAVRADVLHTIFPSADPSLSLKASVVDFFALGANALALGDAPIVTVYIIPSDGTPALLTAHTDSDSDWHNGRIFVPIRPMVGILIPPVGQQFLDALRTDSFCKFTPFAVYIISATPRESLDAERSLLLEGEGSVPDPTFSSASEDIALNVLLIPCTTKMAPRFCSPRRSRGGGGVAPVQGRCRQCAVDGILCLDLTARLVPPAAWSTALHAVLLEKFLTLSSSV